MNNYKEINKAAWNQKTGIHIDSDFYNNESFIRGESSLKQTELDLLGDVKGKSILHLQCHFGQDTISLSRLGANVTGVDLSDNAINFARNMAKDLGEQTKFVCSDIYDLPNVLDEQFDIVFTSYGVIGWLPDMDQWARVISRFMKPDGCFVMVEFHPVAWMFDDNFEAISYSYFKADAIVEQLEGSYADRDSDIQYSTITWNHSLSDVMGSLIRSGIRITEFEEYDYSAYNCFMNMVEIGKDRYQIKNLEDKLPLMFAIKGAKD